MAKYRMLTDIRLRDSDDVLKKGNIIEAPNTTTASDGSVWTTYFYTNKNGIRAAQGLRIGLQAEKVNEGNVLPLESTPKPAPSNQLSDKQVGGILGAIDVLPAAIKRMQIMAFLGTAGGLAYAYKRGSGVGGYFGWAILFSTIGSIIAIASVKIIPPKTGLISDSIKDQIKKQQEEEKKSGGLPPTDKKAMIKKLLQSHDPDTLLTKEVDDKLNKFSQHDLNLLLQTLRMYADPAFKQAKTKEEGLRIAAKYTLNEESVKKGIELMLGAKPLTIDMVNADDVAKKSEMGVDGWNS